MLLLSYRYNRQKHKRKDAKRKTQNCRATRMPKGAESSPRALLRPGVIAPGANLSVLNYSAGWAVNEAMSAPSAARSSSVVPLMLQLPTVGNWPR